ncbi:MAG TPA: twin-arginine translocase subunit TatB [Rhodospirillaceae bacterium]|nr:twin-arginine translocase subunit TatB [Rhodospirillaceae bacterium]
MFDVAWSELALIGAVALVVIGPKDLPRVMRTMGQWTRKARLLAGEFQHNLDEMVRQAELDEVRRQVQAVNPTAVADKVQQMIDPKSIEEALLADPQASVSAPTPPIEPKP